MSIRYSSGNDKLLLAEVSESISLPASFTSLTITGLLRQALKA